MSVPIDTGAALPYVPIGTNGEDAMAQTTKTPTVIRAKVAMDWLNGIVGEYFAGTLSHEEWSAKMREAHDSIKADGLTDEVAALWRLSTYGSR